VRFYRLLGSPVCIVCPCVVRAPTLGRPEVGRGEMGIPAYYKSRPEGTWGSPHDKSVSNIVKKNRHFFCRIIISTQNLMFSDIFRQMDQILIFKGLQHTDKLKQIYDNTDLCVSYETFLRLYNEATKRPWSFLYVDVRNNVFRENLNTLLNVDEEN